MSDECEVAVVSQSSLSDNNFHSVLLSVPPGFELSSARHFDAATVLNGAEVSFVGDVIRVVLRKKEVGGGVDV